MPKRSTLGRWSWERHLDGVSPQVRRPMVAYLERLQGTHARSSVQSTASELAHFGRFLAVNDPGLPSLALLDRQHHIEPYLTEVAAAVSHRTGAPIAASTAKQRIQTVGSFLDAIAEWAGPKPRPGGWCSHGMRPSCRTHCPATCPRIRNVPCFGRWKIHRTGCVPARPCCCARPGCASASCGTSNSTACTRSPARAPG